MRGVQVDDHMAGIQDVFELDGGVIGGGEDSSPLTT
jgi:hypothetical protein